MSKREARAKRKGNKTIGKNSIKMTGSERGELKIEWLFGACINSTCKIL